MDVNDMILITSSNVDGYRVLKQYGIVFGEAVFKHGFLKALGANISDAIDIFRFGSREMSGITGLIEEARTYAYNKMISQAKAKGANAIIAIDSDNTMGEGIMYLSLYGTAVKVVTEEEYEKQLKIEKERAKEKQKRLEQLQIEKEEKKKEMLEEIRRLRAEQGIDLSENQESTAEEMFVSGLSSTKTMKDISQLWLLYDLDNKPELKNLDAYISMKSEMEEKNGSAGNWNK